MYKMNYVYIGAGYIQVVLMSHNSASRKSQPTI